jgi:hypothetical protein
MGVHYFTSRMEEDSNKLAEAERQARLDKELEKFRELVLRGTYRPGSGNPNVWRKSGLTR